MKICVPNRHYLPIQILQIDFNLPNENKYKRKKYKSKIIISKTKKINCLNDSLYVYMET